MRPAVLVLALLALVWAPGVARAAAPGANGAILTTTGVTPEGFWSVAPTDASAERLLDAPHPTAALSPDGRWIAYVDGHLDLFILDVETGTATEQMPGATWRDLPKWSPDSTRVVTTRTVQLAGSDYETKLTVLTADGSAPPDDVATWLGDFTGGNESVQEFVMEPTWTPDGEEIVVIHGRYVCDADPLCPSENSQGYHLQAIDADSGAARDLFPLVMKANNSNDRWTNLLHPDVAGDGSKVVYFFDDGSNQTDYGFRTVPLAGGAQTTIKNPVDDLSRGPVFSPDGQKIAYLRSTGAQQSVLRIMNADGTGEQTVGSPATATNQAAAMEWRAAVPVVFVHGFAASRLECPTASGTQELWPHIGAVDRPQLLAMTLAADGLTDDGDGTCTGAVTPDGVVEEAAGSPVHGPTLDFIERTAGAEAHVYDWDWRKSPEEAVAGLESLVDEVLASTGLDQVTVLAHSMGGLVTRWYLDDASRAAKVSRALIVGTPSWGAPKAILPLAVGQESPAATADLDLFLDELEFKTFAKNLTGGYFLFPSDEYGTWLTVQGRVPSVLDTSGKVVDYVEDDLLGNGALLDQAYDDHAIVLDGWETNGVDVRALVGTGMNTVVGMDFLPGQGGLFAPDAAELQFGNGDETVPARSAVQGTPGTSDPLGEDIPIHYACGVSHVPLAGDAALSDAGAAGFLQFGTPLAADVAPCSNGGFSIGVFGVDLTPVRRRAARRGTSASILDAEASGDVDVIRFPDMAFVVTNDSTPVTLRIDDPDASLVIRRLTGSTQGAPQTVGPDPAGLIVTTSSDGSVDAGPPDPPSPPPPPPDGGGSVDPGPGPGAPPSSPFVPPPSPRPAADSVAPRVRFVVRRRGGRFVVRLRVSDPSGVARVQFRFGNRGRWRAYRRALRLTRGQLRRLRVRATDGVGNTSRPARFRVG